MEKIKSNNLKEMLTECFALDEPLLSLYHIYAGRGLDACVEKTLNDLKKANNSFAFYNVYKNDIHVGFYGYESINGAHCINTIFIRPQFRTKDIVSEFASQLPKPFFTGLYAKNLPAISFYIKQSGRVIKEFSHEGHDVVLIKVGE